MWSTTMIVPNLKPLSQNKCLMNPHQFLTTGAQELRQKNYLMNRPSIYTLGFGGDINYSRTLVV